MTLLKKRSAAIGITAIVCVLCLILGAGSGLRRQRSQVITSYESGTDGSGYGIATDLQKRDTYAGNLATVAQKYDGLFDEEIAAVQDARTQLNEALETLGYGDDYDANAALTTAVEALNEAMKSAELSESDESYRIELYGNLTSRNDTINHEATAFNAEVLSFNELLNDFPANLLSGLAGVEEMEDFG